MKYRKPKHIKICEELLGYDMPDGVEIHHVDSNHKNNSRDNLVICQSPLYHGFLHVRTRALNGCGDVHKKQCIDCKSWLDRSEFRNNKARHDGKSSRCILCDREFHKNYYYDNHEKYKKEKRDYRRIVRAREKEKKDDF